ncbi:hypothetical protein [Mycoplasma sp. CSL10166]|uniref:hypothetical protein n=1 Tax=Mycoplasma sp. CSL10166 TaxID=2813825 RepID=UPI001F122622|nr:hypothetical protein [Mycoplasma sp. CSL10166]
MISLDGIENIQYWNPIDDYTRTKLEYIVQKIGNYLFYVKKSIIKSMEKHMKKLNLPIDLNIKPVSIKELVIELCRNEIYLSQFRSRSKKVIEIIPKEFWIETEDGTLIFNENLEDHDYYILLNLFDEEDYQVVKNKDNLNEYYLISDDYVNHLLEQYEELEDYGYELSRFDIRINSEALELCLKDCYAYGEVQKDTIKSFDK